MNLIDEVMQAFRNQTGDTLREIVYTDARQFIASIVPAEQDVFDDAAMNDKYKIRKAIAMDCLLGYINGYKSASNDDFTYEADDVYSFDFPGLAEFNEIDAPNVEDYIKINALRHANSAYATMLSSGSGDFFIKADLGTLIPKSFISGFKDGLTFEIRHYKTANETDEFLAPDDIRALSEDIAYKCVDEVYNRIASNITNPGNFALFDKEHKSYQQCRDLLYEDTVLYMIRNFFPLFSCVKSIKYENVSAIILGYVQAYINALLDCATGAITTDRIKKAAALPLPEKSDVLFNEKLEAVRRCAELGVPRAIASMSSLLLDDLLNAAPENMKNDNQFYYVTALGYVDGLSRYGEYLELSCADKSSLSLVDLFRRLSAGIGDDDHIVLHSVDDENIDIDINSVLDDIESGKRIRVNKNESGKALIITFISNLGRQDNAEAIVESLSLINGIMLGVIALDDINADDIQSSDFKKFAQWFKNVYWDREDIRNAVEDNWMGAVPEILQCADITF